MVNGILIETEDETSNSPTARVRGFFSGLASLMIARKEDAVLEVSPLEDGISRDKMALFGFSEETEVFSFSFLGIVGDFGIPGGFWGVDDIHLLCDNAICGCRVARKSVLKVRSDHHNVGG
jgi:hypothetical protein